MSRTSPRRQTLHRVARPALWVVLPARCPRRSRVTGQSEAVATGLPRFRRPVPEPHPHAAPQARQPHRIRLDRQVASPWRRGEALRAQRPTSRLRLDRRSPLSNQAQSPPQPSERQACARLSHGRAKRSRAIIPEPGRGTRYDLPTERRLYRTLHRWVDGRSQPRPQSARPRSAVAAALAAEIVILDICAGPERG